MDSIGLTGNMAIDILLSIIVVLLGAYARSQNDRINSLETFRENVLMNYVTKQDFNSLAQELKDSLHRIEDKIERLRDAGK
jgi:Tfp pilus assembly protein PilO